MPANAKYLESMRLLEDADIEEGRPKSNKRWQVDFQRASAAVRTLKIGNGLDSATIDSEDYSSFLERSQKGDFAELDSMNIFRLCGEDDKGVGLVQIDAKALFDASTSGEIEPLLMHMAAKLDAVADKPYSIVFFNYLTEQSAKPEYDRIYTALELYQKKLDHKYDQNLQKLVFVHPSYSLKIAIRFFSPFITDALNEKICFCESMAELQVLVQFELLRIPAYSLQAEEHALADQVVIDSNSEHLS